MEVPVVDNIRFLRPTEEWPEGDVHITTLMDGQRIAVYYRPLEVDVPDNVALQLETVEVVGPYPTESEQHEVRRITRNASGYRLVPEGFERSHPRKSRYRVDRVSGGDCEKSVGDGLTVELDQHKERIVRKDTQVKRR
jgi:hypothetical protein